MKFARVFERKQLMVITAPHFTAGVDLLDGVVVRAAPILHYMLGWPGEDVVKYCWRKDWGCTSRNVE